jgi:hypothetical protein
MGGHPRGEVMPLGNYGGIDEPSFDSAPFNNAKPGDMFPMDADLTIYWPYVAQCWEEKSHISHPNGRVDTAVLPEMDRRRMRNAVS